MNGVIGTTSENTAAMVEAEFGLSNVGKGRYHDLARDLLQGGRKPTQPAALQLLERLQGEADQREAKRVAAVHAKADQTAASWREFQHRRVALSETPAGFRDLGVRDELSGQLLKFRIPSDWIIQP